MRALPIRVVHRGVRFGRVERFVRIELVDEQHEAFVVAGVVGEPARRRGHRAGAWKIRFAAKPAARIVVRHGRAEEARRAGPARIGPRLPSVALVAALIVPGGEVDVIILAARFEEMRMIGDQLRDHAGFAQRIRDRVFPNLDRAPGAPKKIPRAAQNVVARRHAGQRTGVVFGESQRALAQSGRYWASRIRARHRRRACGGSGCRAGGR